MIKKFVAWVKALFAPAKIDDVKVDEYIAKQSRRTHDESDVVLKATVKGDEVTFTKPQTVNQVRFTKPETRPLDDQLNDNQVVVAVDLAEQTKRVVTVEARSTVRDTPVQKTPPKPLNEQLKGVELPAYAKGKTLPPKAKREYIKRAGSPAPARRLDDTPHSTGGHVASHGIDPVNAALYGYAAATILNDDTPAAQPAPVEECRTSHYDAPSYTPSYDSTPSYSSPSYDSPSSYDGGYSGGSCD
ncbi:hypothetical protein CL97_gp041 [Cronobacter phage CR9]|uniref:Uncharacterized protein n=1 Tax=Cronobacter phage CR9 TaxID=1162290 RepID=M1F3F6_9CAUD|nr:hypothetical protein CL97_gp041 [Cronobacter phage CR9]AFH20925.1 hypothetical protein CR9_041 [Cronobacter phage CR9]